MQSYLSGKYWWLSVAAIVALTLIFYHGLIDHSPPIKQVVVVQKPVTHPAAPAPRSAVPSHPVLDLFNPSTAEISREQAISRTRSELEQLLVIRKLLARCAIISELESDAVNAAALDYAVRSQMFADPAATLQELQIQADQTHDLVYSTTSCDEESLYALREQTLAWQAQFAPTP